MKLEYINDWLVNSPDLNPIENVWRILKSRVKVHHSTNSQQLRKTIEKEWNNITYDEINECIFGRPRGRDKGHGGAKGKDCHLQTRIVQCIDRNGLSTEI